jgi:hypothetical protein
MWVLVMTSIARSWFVVKPAIGVGVDVASGKVNCSI